MMFMWTATGFLRSTGVTWSCATCVFFELPVDDMELHIAIIASSHQMLFSSGTLAGRHRAGVFVFFLYFDARMDVLLALLDTCALRTWSWSWNCRSSENDPSVLIANVQASLSLLVSIYFFRLRATTALICTSTSLSTHTPTPQKKTHLSLLAVCFVS